MDDELREALEAFLFLAYRDYEEGLERSWSTSPSSFTDDWGYKAFVVVCQRLGVDPAPIIDAVVK